MSVLRLGQSEVSMWLRELADKFDRGDAVALSCVAALSDGGMAVVRSKSDDVFKLLAAASHLQYTIHRSIEENRE